MERAVALARLSYVSMEDLPEQLLRRRAAPDAAESALETAADIVTLEQLDRRYILRAIALLDGNKSRAAELLGLDRRTLYRRLEKYEADVRAVAARKSDGD